MSRSGLARWGIVAAIVVGAAAVSVVAAEHVPSVETLRDRRAWLDAEVRLHPVLAALGFVGATCVYLLLSLPAEGLLTAMGGLVFGTVGGAALSVAGTVLAAVILFVGLRSVLRGHEVGQGGARARWLGRMQRDGVNYLLALRLLPVLPFALVSLLAVLVRMRLWPYALATAVGVIPPTLVFASLGTGLGSVLGRDAGATLMSWRVLLPLGGMALLAIAPVALRGRIRGR